MYLTLQIHLEDTRRRQRKSPSVELNFAPWMRLESNVNVLFCSQ